MIHHVRRYLSLTFQERWMLTRAMILLALVDLALRVIPLRRLVAHGTHARPLKPVTTDVIQRARLYAYWIDVASRHHLVHARCLHRSLVLHRWLCDRGLPSALRIGVRKDGSVLKAHAWVELGNEIVNDDQRVVLSFTVLRSGGGGTSFGAHRSMYSSGYQLNVPTSAFLRNQALPAQRDA